MSTSPFLSILQVIFLLTLRREFKSYPVEEKSYYSSPPEKKQNIQPFFKIPTHREPKFRMYMYVQEILASRFPFAKIMLRIILVGWIHSWKCWPVEMLALISLFSEEPNKYYMGSGEWMLIHVQYSCTLIVLYQINTDTLNYPVHACAAQG